MTRALQPNRRALCIVCRTAREIFSARPIEPMILTCPHCQKHTTHEITLLPKKPETAQELAAALRRLTRRMPLK